MQPTEVVSKDAGVSSSISTGSNGTGGTAMPADAASAAAGEDANFVSVPGGDEAADATPEATAAMTMPDSDEEEEEASA